MKVSHSLLVAAALLGASSLPVAAADGGWFSGINAAQIMLSNPDGTRASEGTDRLYGNVRINRNFGVEMGYGDVQRFGTESNPGAGRSSISSAVRPRGWQLSGVGTLPLGERMGVFGRVGAYRGDLEMNPNLGGTDLTRATYGMGLKYDVSANLRVQGGWDRYRLNTSRSGGPDTDVDLVSIGLKYKF